MSMQMITAKNAGATQTLAAIDVDSLGVSTLELPSGWSYIKYENTGSEIVWEGDSDVSPATKRGTRLNPGDIVFIDSPSPLWETSFICATNKTSTISVQGG